MFQAYKPIVVNLFSSQIKLEYCPLDVKQKSLNQSSL